MILVILALFVWTAFFESRLLTLPLLEAMIEWKVGVVRVLLLPREEAMMAIVGWGLTLLAVLSYFLARAQQIPAWNVIAEHVVIGVSVIAITHYVGEWVHSTWS